MTKKPIIHLGGMLSYFDETEKKWRRCIPFPEVPDDVLAGLKAGHRQMLAKLWDSLSGLRYIQFPDEAEDAPRAGSGLRVGDSDLNDGEKLRGQIP